MCRWMMGKSPCDVAAFGYTEGRRGTTKYKYTMRNDELTSSQHSQAFGISTIHLFRTKYRHGDKRARPRHGRLRLLGILLHHRSTQPRLPRPHNHSIAQKEGRSQENAPPRRYLQRPSGKRRLRRGRPALRQWMGGGLQRLCLRTPCRESTADGGAERSGRRDQAGQGGDAAGSQGGEGGGVREESRSDFSDQRRR